MRRTLELVADYSVDCSVVNSTVTWSLLKDVAQQKYTVIEALCGSGNIYNLSYQRPMFVYYSMFETLVD